MKDEVSSLPPAADTAGVFRHSPQRAVPSRNTLPGVPKQFGNGPKFLSFVTCPRFRRLYGRGGRNPSILSAALR